MLGMPRRILLLGPQLLISVLLRLQLQVVYCRDSVHNAIRGAVSLLVC